MGIEEYFQQQRFPMQKSSSLVSWMGSLLSSRSRPRALDLEGSVQEEYLRQRRLPMQKSSSLLSTMACPLSSRSRPGVLDLEASVQENRQDMCGEYENNSVEL